MQSPIQYRIPFSGGRQITVPSGPHHYQTEQWVGNTKQGNTPLSAFEALKRHAIPFQGDQTSAEGAVMDVPGLGPIRQHVDDDRLTIVNTTKPGHVLHPGNVFRSIVQRGDDLYVVTEGYGTGILPGLNERARLIWSEPDHRIRHELHPYAGLGYPMDEMNAPAATGARADTMGQPTPSQQPAERPELRISPPIFFSPY
ncbi:hypothetical protein [uncultured Bradyrhizobium sp.]|jgi:hypothetical protein|uniref:hypothetical protein n=1 Tax=uncultured Bradyrhizobium sp. TaxID=199684 RepID=UPI002633B520|nr:hypothetical protein [uncultured Bradyrhizobium sp.]